jgi:hypothetical protein
MAENPITTLINDWPTRRALANELGAKEAAVHKWAASGRIPSEWQNKVVQAARRRGLRYVTPAWMLAQHDRKSEGAA